MHIEVPLNSFRIHWSLNLWNWNNLESNEIEERVSWDDYFLCFHESTNRTDQRSEISKESDMHSVRFCQTIFTRWSQRKIYNHRLALWSSNWFYSFMLTTMLFHKTSTVYHRWIFTQENIESNIILQKDHILLIDFDFPDIVRHRSRLTLEVPHRQPVPKT